MKRILVQLDEETHQQLRQRAFRDHRSIASLVREFVAGGLAGPPATRRRRSVRQFRSVAAGRSVQPPGAPVSERHDEAWADAIER
jgi:plasmid stability protein